MHNLPISRIYSDLLRVFGAALVIFLCATGPVFAQNGTNVGLAKGLLRDSMHNYVMQSATVSVYKAGTGELVSYQLSNNYGRFLFRDLPVDVALRIIATNIGYAPARIDFKIPPATKEIELNTLNMDRMPVSLREVTITGSPPPMQIRGDTLEFNADAFKLDTNAVVEDMLRKLPGVTIWNDGVITVNGKKIKKLLVEGKDFFGDGGKIALQNLPKNAVKKIQIYEDKSSLDPIETKTNMNIVLKNDKKNGYFGKIGGSLGTTHRYDGNGMLSYYSPKNQISIVGSLNNVNKTAENTNTLVNINSFKGPGIGNEYHTDFTKPGATVFKAAGASVLHNFGKERDGKPDTNNLKVGYFMTESDVIVNENFNTAVSFSHNDNLIQTAVASTRSNIRGKVFNANYDKVFDNSNLYAAYDFLLNTSNLQNIRSNTSTANIPSGQSQSYDEQNNRRSLSIHTGNIKFTSRRYTDFSKYRNKSVDMELSYLFRLFHDNQEKKRLTDFSASDASQDKHFNRRYASNSNASEHSVYSIFNNILGYLKRGNPFLRMDIKNSLAFYDKNQSDVVSDFSGANDQYMHNARLSNQFHSKEINYKPGIIFSKSIFNRLSNRYSKTWNINFFSEGQYYELKNSAQQRFQNLQRSYFRFIPSSGIGYSHIQLGKFRRNFLLKYNTAATYPTLQQLAPLVDDANVFFLNYGNINLKAAYANDLAFRFEFNNAEAKNPFRGDVDFSVGKTDNYITDSSYYDELGRNICYPINVSGEKHTSWGGSFQKAFKHQFHQFQLSGKSRLDIATYPSSLNGQFYAIKNRSWFVNADLTYDINGLIVQVGESFSGNRTSRVTADQYKYSNWKTYANISYANPKGFFFSTRLNFNKSISSNNRNINFTIWNVDLGYRFLKGSNGEVKFSGLDLLHQNNNVLSYVNNNSITTGTVNVLQQYFMITLAYYPRKFGLNRKVD